MSLLAVPFLSLGLFSILSDTRTVSTDTGNHTFIAKGEIPSGYDLKVDKIGNDSYDIRIEDEKGNEWQPCDYGKEVEITITNADGYVRHEDSVVQTERDGVSDSLLITLVIML